MKSENKEGKGEKFIKFLDKFRGKPYGFIGGLIGGFFIQDTSFYNILNKDINPISNIVYNGLVITGVANIAIETSDDFFDIIFRKYLNDNEKRTPLRDEVNPTYLGIGMMVGMYVRHGLEALLN